METSYDVKIWKTEVYEGARKTTYRVRWTVDGRPWKESYGTIALADSFRSELVAAARRGEAFDVETGRPISMIRNERKVSWFDFAREYVAMKWPHLAPNSRRNTARALSPRLVVAQHPRRGRPGPARRGSYSPRRTDPQVGRDDRRAGHDPAPRGVLVNAGEYAVERSLLSRNPVTALRGRHPGPSRAWTSASS